ncbi:MAG: AbgT family transporter [Prevotella sp.]|nr:AbgT family transporter [Prevotella sp.]
MSNPLISMKTLSRVVAVLIVAELLLVLLSWLFSATLTADVRPLLSSEGVRWFFAHFVDGLCSPLLVWILLLAMAGGVMKHSGLLSRQPAPRRGLGLRVACLLLTLYAAIILLLTVWPHAVLLSAVGTLWHSPFSRALIPIIALGLILFSTAYGLTVRTFTSLTDVCQSLVDGLCLSAPLLVIYVLFIQFYESLHYVFF